MAAATGVSGLVPSKVALTALLLSFFANIFLVTLLLSSQPSALQNPTYTIDAVGNGKIGSDVSRDCLGGVGGSSGSSKKEAASGEAAASAAAPAWRSTLRVEGGVVEDPWLIGKAVPPPDDCKCAGYVIEQLEPEYNFRRGFALGFEEEVESKVHLMPYLRAFQDLSLRDAKRRILLDLGGNLFDTSVTWFLQYYPLDFTEVHVFEACGGMFRVPSPVSVPLLAANGNSTSGGDGHHGELVSNITCLLDDYSIAQRNRQDTNLRGPFPFPAWELSRIHLYECAAGVVGSDGSSDADGGNNTTHTPDDKCGEGCRVNVMRFIKEKLRVAPEDTLIVKMDVEGAEWDILPVWMSDTGEDGLGGITASMVELVDELLVEVHYHHPTMYQHHWKPERFPHSIEEATQLLRDMRSNGFFVHAWP